MAMRGGVPVDAGGAGDHEGSDQNEGGGRWRSRGMVPTMGAMKMANRKRMPVVMAVTPVRPPAATPAEDSM